MFTFQERGSDFEDCPKFFKGGYTESFFESDCFPQEEDNLLSGYSLLIEEPNLEIPAVTADDDFADLYEYKPKQTLSLLRKRKSEDWDYKPLQTDTTQFPKSFDESLVSQHEDFTDFLFDLERTQKKMKMSSLSVSPAVVPLVKRNVIRKPRWIKSEVKDLWVGVQVYGNNWGLIKDKFFTNRTYHQVKDKARRLLAKEGWNSTSEEASKSAKTIAIRVIGNL